MLHCEEFKDTRLVIAGGICCWSLFMCVKPPAHCQHYITVRHRYIRFGYGHTVSKPQILSAKSTTDFEHGIHNLKYTSQMKKIRYLNVPCRHMTPSRALAGIKPHNQQISIHVRFKIDSGKQAFQRYHINSHNNESCSKWYGNTTHLSVSFVIP